MMRGPLTGPLAPPPVQPFSDGRHGPSSMTGGWLSSTRRNGSTSLCVFPQSAKSRKLPSIRSISRCDLLKKSSHPRDVWEL